jgi:amino acid adenylation domain-containing protein
MYRLESILDRSFRRAPNRIAISQEDRTITYAELDRRANQIAHLLLETLRPDEFLVGITSAVTIDSVAAIIGILRAGRAYLPLDCLSPPTRLNGILDDAGVRTIVCDPLAYPAWRELGGQGLERKIGLDAFTGDHQSPNPARGRDVMHDDLAYVLYTSGSTGTPKGVMLTHRNALTFVRWMGQEFQISAEDRVAGRSPLNFDFSVFDIFNSLAASATLVLSDLRRGTLDGLSSERRHRRYVDMLARESATVLYATPSNLTVLTQKGGLNSAVPLRLVMYAGEPFHPAMLARFMEVMPQTRIANIYGPTETNIVTCAWVKEPPTTAVPLGRPVDDTEILVVRDGKLCAPGEVGELWVRGGTVCIGYLGKPELTAQRLVKSPFHPYPVSFWRTGDLGKVLPDGDLAYLGRADDMVKTRGYRVELGDVEAALAVLDGVAQAVVVHRPDERYGATLHAFVAMREGRPTTPSQLLAGLAKRVPSYMVPADLRIVDSFSYTSTGKVDRQQLLATLRA